MSAYQCQDPNKVFGLVSLYLRKSSWYTPLPPLHDWSCMHPFFTLSTVLLALECHCPVRLVQQGVRSAHVCAMLGSCTFGCHNCDTSKLFAISHGKKIGSCKVWLHSLALAKKKKGLCSTSIINIYDNTLWFFYRKDVTLGRVLKEFFTRNRRHPCWEEAVISIVVVPWLRSLTLHAPTGPSSKIKVCVCKNDHLNQQHPRMHVSKQWVLSAPPRWNMTEPHTACTRHWAGKWEVKHQV